MSNRMHDRDEFALSSLEVARSFDRAARSYDAAAVLQARVRDELLSRLVLVRLRAVARRRSRLRHGGRCIGAASPLPAEPRGVRRSVTLHAARSGQATTPVAAIRGDLRGCRPVALRGRLDRSRVQQPDAAVVCRPRYGLSRVRSRAASGRSYALHELRARYAQGAARAPGLPPTRTRTSTASSTCTTSAMRCCARVSPNP